MGLLATIGPFIDLGSQILQMIGTDEAMKYIDALNKARTDLQSEIAKGYDSDDSKIEAIYGQIQLLGETIKEQLSAYKNNQPPASLSSSPTVKL